MKSQQYGPSFGPEELEALAAAFHSAWQDMSTLGSGQASEFQMALAKRTLADRIIAAAAKGGAADVAKLKERALRSWRREKLTPFMGYAAFFGPGELEAMTAAYDSAWQKLWATGLALTPREASLIKKQLAQVILASACTGERKLERLKDAALRALSGARLSKALWRSEGMPRACLSLQPACGKSADAQS